MIHDYFASKASPYCGRIDKHPPHTWSHGGRSYDCPGPPITEGSNVTYATLYIDTWYSKCGACGKNADPQEKSHVMLYMKGEGCGATFNALSSNYAGDRIREAATAMRPDLPWAGLV